MNVTLLLEMEEASTAILTLTEGVSRDELRGSRLTREQVRQRLVQIADALALFMRDGNPELPELDLCAWTELAARLRQRDESSFDALWSALEQLTPSTLIWLRLYRTRHPDAYPTARATP